MSTQDQEMPAYCPHCGGLLGHRRTGLDRAMYAESTRALTMTKTTWPTKTMARVRSAGRLIVLDGDLRAADRLPQPVSGQNCASRLVRLRVALQEMEDVPFAVHAGCEAAVHR